MEVSSDKDTTIGRDVIGGNSHQQTVHIPQLDLQAFVKEISALSRANAVIAERLEHAVNLLVDHNRSLIEFRQVVYDLFKKSFEQGEMLSNQLEIQQKMQELAILIGKK